MTRDRAASFEYKRRRAAGIWIWGSTLFFCNLLDCHAAVAGLASSRIARCTVLYCKISICYNQRAPPFSGKSTQSFPGPSRSGRWLALPRTYVPPCLRLNPPPHAYMMVDSLMAVLMAVRRAGLSADFLGVLEHQHRGPLCLSVRDAI